MTIRDMISGLDADAPKAVRLDAIRFGTFFETRAGPTAGPPVRWGRIPLRSVGLSRRPTRKEQARGAPLLIDEEGIRRRAALPAAPPKARGKTGIHSPSKTRGTGGAPHAES